MSRRILLRAAVLIGGCAAATAVGLGISGGPASADSHPVRGLLGAVGDLVDDALPAPAATPHAAGDKLAAKSKPHKPDRPAHKVANVVGDVVRGAKNAVGHLARPASMRPAPAVDSDGGPSTKDGPAATDLLEALLGPAVTTPAPTIGTAPPLDSCAAGTRALGSTAGHHRSSLAAPGRRPHRAAPAPPAELAPQPPPAPPAPEWADGTVLSLPAPSAPSIDALPATLEHCAPQTPGAVFGGDRDAASRTMHPSAPSG